MNVRFIFFPSGIKTVPLSAWQVITMISQFGFAISNIIEAICQLQQSKLDVDIHNGSLFDEVSNIRLCILIKSWTYRAQATKLDFQLLWA